MQSICFIIGSMSGGGAERVISILSNRLVSDGYKVSIIQFRDPLEESYELDSRIIVKTISNNKESRIKRLLKLLPQLVSNIKSIQADVYISFCIMENIFSLVANIFTRKCLVISERNAPKQEDIGIIFSFLRKILYSKANGIVFQTDEAMHAYSSSIQEKGIVIYNPLSDKLPVKNSYKSNFNIVAVGRLAEQKNYPMLFRAFKLFLNDHNNYILNIYGSGPIKEELISLTNELDINNKVIFHGFVSNIHEKLVCSDMYVLTSNYEGMPNSLMESMAIGVPCISTNCPSGGPKQLITSEQNGYLVNLEDHKNLYKIMSMLASDELTRKKIGCAAKQSLSQYDARSITEQWILFLNKCIQK